MSFFISNAFAAESAAPADANNPMVTLALLVACGLIFFFMVFRPQQKRAKEHKSLMSSITKGDEVLTNGGLVGRVVKITDNGYVTIALNDNNDVIVKKEFIAAVLPKGTMQAS